MKSSAVPNGGGELARLATIARVAAAKGWAHYAQRLGFEPAVAAGAAPPAGTDAERLREAFEELGPTFVKFGQMISTRTDLFPADITAELGRLHSRAAPFAGEAARRIVEAETGQRIEELFATFDAEPFAAASIAQVHRATLPGGARVVVKVQRPGIEDVVESDIAILRRLAQLLHAGLPASRPLNLPDLVAEFADTIRGELDFEREARNTERFAAVNADEKDVFVPRVFRHASARRVLTMDHSPGSPIDRAAPAAQRARLAQALMRLFLTHVFEHGVFHGDPHPGNVFLAPDGRICFHDFGALGELSPALQESLRQVFLAVMARDAPWLASAYLGMGGASGELDRAAFARGLGEALGRYYADSAAGRRSFSSILHAFVRLGREHHIRLLRETALLLRAFGELEGMVRELDPRFDSLGAFKAFSPRLLRHAFMPRAGLGDAAELYRMASALTRVARDTPVALGRLLGRLERGEPLFDIRHQSGGSLERHLLHASNRLAFAVIIAAIVIGSAIVLATDAGPRVAGLPVLGIVGFVVAGILGVAWAVLALRSGQL